jgi:quercetin dioxygenase-like cupin family protein
MKLEAALLVLLAWMAGPSPAHREPKVTSLLTRHLVEGAARDVEMITVEYEPGGRDPVHRHDAHGFIYVLEGSVVMQVKGGEPVTLGPGDTFYEGPADVHVVGRNASDTDPAKFLVFLVKEEGAPAFVPVE